MPLSLTQKYGKVIEGEFLFGLTQFQNIVDSAVENLTETEINFMSEGINLIISYNENLTYQSQLLFENYGFVVDHKQVYELMWTLRRTIKSWISQLIGKSSAIQIKKSLSRIFGRYSLQLKTVFETEVGKICSALDKNDKVMECWEAYKVPILELGFEVISALESLTLNEAKRLTELYNELERDVSSDINQIISDLSLTGSTHFSKRLIVKSFVS